MDKRKNHKIYKVENSIYMSREEIEKNFWGNALVLTNMEFTPKGEPYKWVGGKVQYYAKYLKDLYKIGFGPTFSSDEYGECGFWYVGDMGRLLV